MNGSTESTIRKAGMARRGARRLRCLGLAAAVAFALTACFAQQAKAQPARVKKAPPAAKSKDANTKTFAKLQARAHRLMAKIIEAEAAAKPDQAKIEKLYTDLQSVRQKMWALGPNAGWGPGAGRGRMRGGAWGRGGGPGWNRGGGPGWKRGGRARGGPGGGWGRGRGATWGGRGPGWRGAGAARGAGANVGNCQPGQCQGPNWVDKDRNGVCDHYEGVAGAPAPAAKKKGK